MASEVCENCHGTGKVIGGMTCIACNGSGDIATMGPDGQTVIGGPGPVGDSGPTGAGPAGGGSAGDHGKLTCGTCSGTGTYNGSECPACAGAGLYDLPSYGNGLGS